MDYVEFSFYFESVYPLYFSEYLFILLSLLTAFTLIYQKLIWPKQDKQQT